MSHKPYRPQALQWQVFHGSRAVSDGLLTPHQLRSSAWVRIRHDVYADSRLDYDHRLACQATALWLPPGAAIAGPSAAYLYGVEHAARHTDDVHVITAPENRFGPQHGVRVHRTPVAPAEIMTSGDLPRTTPLRTSWDVAAWLDLVPAVTVLDGMLRRRLVDRPELDSLLAERLGAWGSARARHAFGLTDGRAESPPESVIRVRLVLAGLPPPVPQHPIRLGTGAVYRPDLPWPEYQVAVEYDGRWHGAPDQLERDRRRLNQLVSAGWIILHATSQHLGGEFWRLVSQTRAALRSRGWRDPRA